MCGVIRYKNPGTNLSCNSIGMRGIQVLKIVLIFCNVWARLNNMHDTLLQHTLVDYGYDIPIKLLVAYCASENAKHVSQ